MNILNWIEHWTYLTELNEHTYSGWTMNIEWYWRQGGKCIPQIDSRWDMTFLPVYLTKFRVFLWWPRCYSHSPRFFMGNPHNVGFFELCLLVYKPPEYSYKFYLRIRNHSDSGVFCTHQLSYRKPFPGSAVQLRCSAVLFRSVTEESTNLSSKNPWTEEIATSTPLGRSTRSTVGIFAKGWWWFFFGWNLWCSHWVNFHAGHFGSFLDWPVKAKLF